MNRVLKSTTLVALSAAALMAVGCQQGWQVQRTDPRQPVDLDYRFNDEDARQIFHEMAGDMLSRPWIESHMRAHGGDQRPIVYLATVRNNTQDYIPTELFTNQLEEAMLNSGRVRVKAERDARADIRDERLDTRYNDPATVKAVAKELNADFALMGSITDVKQQAPGGAAIMNYYQARMELINVETAEKVWTRVSEIKKVASRR
ncbi:MAG: hypothetical protein WD749_04025 [Phycisphaerales bacterium]